MKLLHAMILPFLISSVNTDSSDDIHQKCLRAGLNRLQGGRCVSLFSSLLKSFNTCFHSSLSKHILLR